MCDEVLIFVNNLETLAATGEIFPIHDYTKVVLSP
jgi:hypothetical protein